MCMLVRDCGSEPPGHVHGEQYSGFLQEEQHSVFSSASALSALSFLFFKFLFPFFTTSVYSM